MSSYDFAEFKSSSITQNGKSEIKSSGRLKRKRENEDSKFYLLNSSGKYIEVNEENYMKAPLNSRKIRNVQDDKYEYSIMDNEYAYPDGYNMFSVSNINRYFNDEMPKLFNDGFNNGNFRN